MPVAAGRRAGLSWARGAAVGCLRGVVTAGAQVVAVRCLHPGWEGVSVCGVRGEVPCRPSESERLNYWENSEVADQFHL